MMPTWKTHMSEKEAIQMYDSGWWQDATDEAILDRQLFEDDYAFWHFRWCS